MLEILDWNTQIPTLIDMIEYYLSQGIVFSDDFISFNGENDSKETLKGIKLTKQESIKEKTQRFVSRIEKSKSLIEKNDYFETHEKKQENFKENWKKITELSEKELSELLNKIEKEVKLLTNTIIKGYNLLKINVYSFWKRLSIFRIKLQIISCSINCFY